MDKFGTPVAFQFGVMIAQSGDGAEAVFQEVSGLDAEIQPEQLSEGGENRFQPKRLSPVRHANLMLRRGVASRSDPFVSWCYDTLESGLTEKMVTKDVQITLRDGNSRAVRVWILRNAYPVKLAADGFDAPDKEVALDQIELAYSSIERKT